MTTFRGVMRSYNSAVKRAARVQQQRNREALKRYKIQQKAEQLQNGIQAEKDWSEYVIMLKSLHKDHTEEIDWNIILEEPRLVEPIKQITNSEKIQTEIDAYTPSFIDKLFGLTSYRKRDLNKKLMRATSDEEFQHSNKMNSYKKELEEWETLQRISTGIKQRDAQAYKDALEFFNPFEDVAGLGKVIKFKINEDYIDIELETTSKDVIPEIELSLTSTGKLSQKDMSNSKFNELYFEHLSSCVIRIAKEISIYLPVTYIVITVVSNDLNKATGNQQSNIILSILTFPKVIKSLNLSNLAPIETIKSFKNNIKFNKTNGFQAVPKIELGNTILSNK